MILAYRSFFTPLILYQYFYTITVWLFFFINSYFFIPEYFLFYAHFVANISFILGITFSFLS